MGEVNGIGVDELRSFVRRSTETEVARTGIRSSLTAGSEVVSRR